MEFFIAPFSADYSIEFFRCSEKFCGRCFSERLGYILPKKDDSPVIRPDQPICEKHGRPMFISSLDRQRNTVTYTCSEAHCPETLMKR
jgi:hypothetical protein